MFYNLSISVIFILFFNYKKYFFHKHYINKASTLVTRIYIIIYIPTYYLLGMYKKCSLNYKKGGCLNNKYLRDL
jgi:hypothetical protein